MRQPPSCTLVFASYARMALPPLRSWEFVRTDGESADAFCVEFAYNDLLAAQLPTATELLAEVEGVRVFTGRVDEYELFFDENGTGVRLCGRGMAALLLDNQVTGRVFSNACLKDILEAYVRPFGIACEQPHTVCLTNFTVDTADTCMQALKGFCAHAGLLTPYFDASGSLLLRTKRTDSGMRIAQSQVLEACLRDNRYGVISQQTVVDLKTGAATVVRNRPFLARGGACKKVVCGSSTDTLHAAWRTAQQRVDAAQREEVSLQLTLAGNFSLPPAQTVSVSLPALHIDGKYGVREVCSRGSEAGSTCTLILYEW